MVDRSETHRGSNDILWPEASPRGNDWGRPEVAQWGQRSIPIGTECTTSCSWASLLSVPPRQRALMGWSPTAQMFCFLCVMDTALTFVVSVIPWYNSLFPLLCRFINCHMARLCLVTVIRVLHRELPSLSASHRGWCTPFTSSTPAAPGGSSSRTHSSQLCGLLPDGWYQNSGSLAFCSQLWLSVSAEPDTLERLCGVS